MFDDNEGEPATDQAVNQPEKVIGTSMAE